MAGNSSFEDPAQSRPSPENPTCQRPCRRNSLLLPTAYRLRLSAGCVCRSFPQPRLAASPPGGHGNRAGKQSPTEDEPMGQWLERRSMPTPRHDLQSVAVNGSIYAISGADDLTLHVVEVYDVENDVWIQGPPIPTSRSTTRRRPNGRTAPPCRGRCRVRGWAAHEGRIFVFGGCTDKDPDNQFRDELYVLDPAVGKWEPLAPQPTGRESQGSPSSTAACTPSGAAIPGTRRPTRSTTSPAIPGPSPSRCRPARPGSTPAPPATGCSPWEGPTRFRGGGHKWIHDLHEYVP